MPILESTPRPVPNYTAPPICIPSAPLSERISALRSAQIHELAQVLEWYARAAAAVHDRQQRYRTRGHEGNFCPPRTHTPPHTHTTAHALPHTDARSAVRKCVHDGRLTSGPATYADSDAITQLSEPTAPAHTPHLVWPNPNPPHTAPAPARTQLTAPSARSARSPAPPRPAPSVASGNRPRHPCGRRCYLARRCGASRIILSCRHTLGAFSLESGRT